MTIVDRNSPSDKALSDDPEAQESTAMAGLLILALTCLVWQQFAPAPVAPEGTVLAFWQYAIPAALSIGSSLLNRNKSGTGQTEADRALRGQEARDRSRGTAAEDAYLDYASNFDAGEAARTTAGALSQDWRKEFGRDIEALRGNQVARGRLDSGFGMEDEDRYVTDFNDNVAKQLAALSMQTAGMNLGAQERRGAYGTGMVGRATDLTAGRRDQALVDAASRRAMYGNIGAALLGAGGQVAAARYGRAG